jgi:hypothetical protein
MALARAKATTAQLTKLDHAIVFTGENDLLIALTRWFASADAIAASALPDDLLDRLVASGIKRVIAERVGRMVLSKPMAGRTRSGAPTTNDTAMRRVASEEPQMRALYVLAACKRLTAAAEDGDPASAMDKERRYLAAHVAAGRGRRAAAKKVDDLGADLLVWRTQEDSRVDSRCASNDHRLFTVGNPPGGVYPGAAHPACRCYAVVWGSPLFQA